MPKSLPFDLSVFDEPSLTRLSPYQAGLFYRLVFDYWRSGIPLPDTDKELIELSNANVSRWDINKPKVMAAIDKIMPILAKKRERRKEVYNLQKKNGIRAYQASLSKRTRKKAILSDQSLLQTGFSALPERKEYNEGMTDLTARKAALDAVKEQDRQMLKDK